MNNCIHSEKIEFFQQEKENEKLIKMKNIILYVYSGARELCCCMNDKTRAIQLFL